MPKKNKSFTEEIFDALKPKKISTKVKPKKKNADDLDTKIINGLKKFLESPF